MSFWKIVITVAFVFAFAGPLAPSASACDYVTLRDAAFDEERDVHWLGVIAKAGDPAGQRIHNRLAAWLDENGEGLNIELVQVAADDPDVAWAKDFGFDFAPTPETPLPAVVLVGRRGLDRTGFVIDAWQPAPTVEQLNQLKSSPAREAIRNEIGQKLAVLLYVPGAGQKAGTARQVLDSVVTTWAEKARLGVSVVSVDRTDEREWLLMSFADVPPSGPDFVAVVFGRGKFMWPPDDKPIEGERITEQLLNEMIEILMGDCTCAQPPRSLGVDVPMTWDKSLDGEILTLYDGEGAPPSTQQGLPVGGTGAAASQHRVLTTSMWTLGGIALIGGVAATALVWRKHRMGS